MALVSIVGPRPPAKQPPRAVAKAAEISKRSVKEGVLIRELVTRDEVIPADEIAGVLDLRKMTEIGVPQGKHAAVAGG